MFHRKRENPTLTSKQRQNSEWLLQKHQSKLPGEHFTEPHSTVPCVLTCRRSAVLSFPVVFLVPGLGYQCHRSLVSLYVNHTAVMDDFMELTSDLTEKLLCSESWGEIEIIREVEQHYAGRGIYWLALTAFLLLPEQTTISPGGPRRVREHHRYQLTESFVFPVSSNVFCKFCSYTADRSMLWFASSREVGTPSGTSYF